MRRAPSTSVKRRVITDRNPIKRRRMAAPKGEDLVTLTATARRGRTNYERSSHPREQTAGRHDARRASSLPTASRGNSARAASKIILHFHAISLTEKRESTFGAPKRLAGQPAHWHHQSIRAFALERGHRGATGTALPAGGGPRILAVPSDVLSPRMARVIEGLASDWRHLDERIEGLSGEVEEFAKRDAGCERLMSIPGIGPIISSAMVAAIGTGDRFSKGRNFAAWAGARPQANLDGRPHHPGQNIEARQSLPARSVRASSVGRACEGEVEQMGRPRAQALDRDR